MRISLVSSVNLPGWFDQNNKSLELAAPVGILSLAAVLIPKGHAIFLDDLNYDIASGNLCLDDNFYDSAANKILSNDPGLVGFSTMCNSFHVALRLAEAVRRKAPGVKIVFGGPQASMVDKETLASFPWVDFILRGEAEPTIGDFIDELQSGTREFCTPGLTWRDASGAIVRNPDSCLLPDLDTLPMPAYDLVPYGAGNSLSLEAGRGCPFWCSFCSTSVFWRRRFRVKSIPRLIEEIKTLRSRYNINYFSFRHDLFTFNRKRVLQFCEALKKEIPGLTWACSARLDCVQDETLKIMGESGCKGIFYGLETGSQRMQKEIRKNLKLDRVMKTIETTLSAGIDPTVSFITGFPSEEPEDLHSTLAMIQELLLVPRVSVQLHLLGPEQGTRDWKDYRDRLEFDGYYSDISGSSSTLLEPEWFQQYPDLFASFHYYRSNALPRLLLRGIDLFVHGPCSILKKTIQKQLESSSLYDLYLAWKTWAVSRDAGGGPGAGQKVEEYLLDYYRFTEYQVNEGNYQLDLGMVRDEILAFILEFYEDTHVHWVKQQPVAEDQAPVSEPLTG